MKKKTQPCELQPTLLLPVIRGKVLGVQVYRGYARLCDLSRISRADIYDQNKNPHGTQRDLSPKHARDAYNYIKACSIGFWPEVFLCVREKKVATFKPNDYDNPDFGMLSIDSKIATQQEIIAISRVDGNHRLHYAGGEDPKFSPIEKNVSFCLAYDLTRNEEIQLFKDINVNQKAMNTSHLDNIEVRLSAEEQLKRKSPELYIAQKLGRDESSPLYNRVFEGGRKSSNVDLPLRSLKTGIEYMLSRSTQLPIAEDTDAQYKIIRNYLLAIKEWQPKAWSQPKEHIMLRGVGLWAICFIGANVIDRVLLQDKFSSNDMLKVLNSGKEWDWSNKGDFKGYSGRAGALEISKKISSKLYDDKRMSSTDLFKAVLASK